MSARYYPNEAARRWRHSVSFTNMNLPRPDDSLRFYLPHAQYTTSIFLGQTKFSVVESY